MSKNKLLLLLVLLMAATGAVAQSTPITTVRSWEFTKGGNHSDWASAQAAATSVWGGPDSSLRYSNANNLSGEELTDGTNPLNGLAGIYFTAPAGSLLLGGKDSSTKCLQTSGNGISILLPDCAAKDRITIRFCASVKEETVTITSDQMKSSYVANSTDRSHEVSAFVKENGNVVLNVPSKVRIYEIKVEPYVAVTNFNLSTETVNVAENKTVTVTATGFSPSNAFDKTLEWTTADKNVATVANGVITGVNPGTTTITVTSVDGPSKTIGVTVLPTYSVTLAEGTEDADKWTVKVGEGEAQAFPVEGLDGGETVTVTYSGEKKVKSVKAVKKVAPITDLATITADYEAKDGETLTGKLASNVKISIADGATVTLKDVNITNLGNNCNWEGISCPGDATLVLEGTNEVCAGRDDTGYNNYPGIWIAPDKTLTIQGNGTLTAYSNGTQPFAAGIGGGYGIACGNIVINSGTITATGGWDAAGIGGGQGVGCGNITINGGTVTATGGDGGAGIGGGDAGEDRGSCGNITISGGTVEATGGNCGAGIGGGNSNGACGTITITKGVTSVTATKGGGEAESIGKGDGGQDITVNIENGANVTQK